MTKTLHQIDFTFVEPGIGGMEISLNPKLSLDEKFEEAYEALNELYPEYEDVLIVKLEDTAIDQE